MDKPIGRMLFAGTVFILGSTSCRKASAHEPSASAASHSLDGVSTFQSENVETDRASPPQRMEDIQRGTGPLSDHIGNAPGPGDASGIPAQANGNLFPAVPPNRPTYWNGIEGHLTVEGGIAGNPWTRSGRNFGQFYVDRANTVTLNQIMGALSHPVTNIGSGYGLGFVMEVMYGSDARFDPTIGMADKALTGLYQIAPSQAHIDLHVPWFVKQGIDLQLGQICGIMGAEGTPALARPFYTVNYASAYIVPFETVGILSTTHFTGHLDGILRVDAGNSTTFGNAGNNSRPKGYIGLAFTHLMAGKLDGHLIGHFGPQGNNGPVRRSPDGWTSIGIGRAANREMLFNGDVLLTYHFDDQVSMTVNGTYLHDNITRDDSYGVTT